MRECWRTRRLFRVVGLLLIPAAAALSGCGGSHDAEAAQKRRIETFSVNDGTLVLLADTSPTVEVKDGTTVYTAQSSGSMSFQARTGAVQTYSLDSGDVVIERPGVGFLTFIRSQ